MSQNRTPCPKIGHTCPSSVPSCQTPATQKRETPGLGYQETDTDMDPQDF